MPWNPNNPPAPKPGEIRYRIDGASRQVTMMKYGAIITDVTEVSIPFHDAKQIAAQIINSEALEEIHMKKAAADKKIIDITKHRKH